MREIISIAVSIFCLAVMFSIAMRPEPEERHVAPPEIKRIMQKHGTPVLECRGTVCSFERDGKVVKIRH